MAATVEAKLSQSGTNFQIFGGSPQGKDEVHAAIKRWPGWKRLNVAGKFSGMPCSVYSGAVTPISALKLSTTSLNLVWDPQAQAVMNDWLTRLHAAERALGHPQPLGVGLTLPTARKPRDHQLACLWAAPYLDYRVLLSDDMGLGKTSEALWCAHQCGCPRLMIVCPVSVKFNWEREIRETLGQDWCVLVIDGTPTKRANTVAALQHAMGYDDPVAAIINYDLLLHLPEQQRETLRMFANGGFLICDESHYLKNRNSKRTQLVHELFGGTKGAAYRMLLTGTPIRNMADDLFSQVELIRPGTWSSYWDFAKRHLQTARVTFGARAVNKVTGVKNLNELNAVLNTVQIRRKKEDVLDLPPKVYTYPDLDIDSCKDTKKIYKAMKDFARLQLAGLPPDTSIFQPQAQSGVEAALRCEQIAQGFVGGIPEPLMNKLSALVVKKAQSIPGRPRELLFPDSPKMKWLCETIDSLLLAKKRVVVFSRFNAPLFWLAEQQFSTWDAPVLHGSLNSVQKFEITDGFCEGAGNILFCQVKMAEGWNAYTAQECIFLGRDWSPAINSQAEDRLHRDGQKGTVNVQIPIVRGTIETMIHKKLAAKAADAHQALKTVTVQELIEAL